VGVGVGGKGVEVGDDVEVEVLGSLVGASTCWLALAPLPDAVAYTTPPTTNAITSADNAPARLRVLGVASRQIVFIASIASHPKQPSTTPNASFEPAIEDIAMIVCIRRRLDWITKVSWQALVRMTHHDDAYDCDVDRGSTGQGAR